jgi:hypothetical protein
VSGDYQHANDLLRDVSDTAESLLAFKDSLAARLRAGGPPPSDAWWRRYEEAKARWDSLRVDVAAHFGSQQESPRLPDERN